MFQSGIDGVLTKNSYFLRGFGALAVVLLFVQSFPVRAQTDFGRSGYILNTGDTLEFNLLEEDDPTARFVIGSDGHISLPLIGGVLVRGLTLADARDRIQQEFKNQQMFKDPQVELRVVSYRPITVLGDVKNPGIFEYENFLTIEQAVGLAGGTSQTFVDPEQRLLRRRELEYALSENDSDLALAAAVYARLQSQLESSDEITIDAVPEAARKVVNLALFDGHVEIESGIVSVEENNYTTQVDLLQEAISTSLDQLTLIEQREQYAQQSVDTASETIERMNSLLKRGLVTENQGLRTQQELSSALANLVSIGESKNTMRREIGRFRRELSELQSQRSTRLMNDLQSRSTELQKLLSRRRSIQDQLDLLGQWIEGNPTGVMEEKINYVLRRRGGDGSVEVRRPDPFEELLPGDILTVSVLPLQETVGSGDE